jgi:hypothetical protein
MATAPTQPPSRLETAVTDLFHYAIDREDVKWLMARLHPEARVPRTTVEYELQLLKIVSVGWCMAYSLENAPHKAALLEGYWQAVRNYAHELSRTTGLMIGQNIAYFETLKTRLDHYLGAMAQAPEGCEPAATIGPQFAGLCGNREDLHAHLAGAKMFTTTVGRVRQYLAASAL